MESKSLSELRLDYKPQIPDALDDIELLVGYSHDETHGNATIQTLFPKTHSQPIVHFQKGYPPKHVALKAVSYTHLTLPTTSRV